MVSVFPGRRSRGEGYMFNIAMDSMTDTPTDSHTDPPTEHPMDPLTNSTTKTTDQTTDRTTDRTTDQTTDRTTDRTSAYKKHTKSSYGYLKMHVHFFEIYLSELSPFFHFSQSSSYQVHEDTD